jgi:3',5'-cyclic AMP phosphodiesterase CpdA
MTETITLAQMSDVHLAPVRGLALRHLNLKRGLGYLNWQRSRRFVHRRESLDLLVADMMTHRPDHIAVTGDLINLGLPVEYEAALTWLESLGPPADVTVIPGNHDIYTRLVDDSGIDRWAAYMRADAAGAAFAKGARARFPFVRCVGPVALIGLNSAVETRPFVASGQLGPFQLQELARLLSETERAGLVRVVLIHHPPLPGLAPPRRALRDAAALARVLEEHGAELVLYGHNHRDKRMELAWSRGRIPVIGVASGSGGRAKKDESPGSYNLLRLGRESGRALIECTTYVLNAERTRVQPLEHKLIA